jgi:hypothetical protein
MISAISSLFFKLPIADSDDRKDILLNYIDKIDKNETKRKREEVLIYVSDT